MLLINTQALILNTAYTHATVVLAIFSLLYAKISNLIGTHWLSYTV